MRRHVDRQRVALCAALGVGALFLSLTVVPGLFTIDEANYLITTLGLRAGKLTVPGTEGLPPSRELRYFDAALRLQNVSDTPVSSTAPPLYAFLSLPFSYLGWRGLVAVNTLAFLLAGAVVFGYARDFAASPRTPWIAVGVFALGGYLIEYAQGVWPHMLAVVLCIASVYLTSRVRNGGALGLAFAAGLMVGMASGIRYQNVIVAGAIGLGLLVWARKRATVTMIYALGLFLPLAACSIINHVRLDSWNPISKGPYYLNVGVGGPRQSQSNLPPASEPVRGGRAVVAGPTYQAVSWSSLGAPWVGSPSVVSSSYPDETRSWSPGLPDGLVEGVELLSARIVDHALYPELPEHLRALHPYMLEDPRTGVTIIEGAVKKAWLQSCPWLVVSFLAIVGAWLGRGNSAHRRVPELRAFTLIVLSVMVMFALAGPGRVEGLSFNQRYFIELMPLMAIAFAWAVERVRPKKASLVLGAAASASAMALVLPADPAIRHLALAKAPLIMALLAGAGWLVRMRRPSAESVLGIALGMSLTWALGVHLLDDLAASRRLRRANQLQKEQAEPVLPDHSALFAYWGGKDPFAPLQLDRDLLILDPWGDDGETAPALVDALWAQGRRVFVRLDGFPPMIFHAMSAGRAVEGVATAHVETVREPIRLVELVPRGP